MDASCLFRPRALILGAALGLTGCATSQAPPAVPPANVDLRGAVRYLAAELARQLSPWEGERVLVVDPVLERDTGQQTGVSREVEERLGPALTSAIPGLIRLRFDDEGVGSSRLVLTGTVAAAKGEQYTVSVALTDRSSGLVVAQSAARFSQTGLDSAPTAFYSDSPSLVRDRSVDGYVRTSQTPAGQLADPLYVEQLPTSALLAQALTAYNEGLWEAALNGYTAAAARSDGQQLRTFNGLYLCNLRLGRLDAAEDAFGRIAALGLATNNLAVKLLFRPGTTEFWPGSELSGMYPVWLRQIARATSTTKRCLEIVGHTSRTGTEAFNEQLSLARANAVERILAGEAPELVGHLRARGRGFRDNIIGSGADDASDAVDRRVEFAVVSCAPSSS